MIDTLPQRIASKIVPDEATGCWAWTGATMRYGYGRVSWNNANRLVHRVVYTLLVSEPPQGMDLDHLCRNPNCCNPAHLETVTHRENIRRGRAPIARQMAQTHCIRGHPFAGENLRYYRGSRVCRACQIMHSRNQRARARAA